MKVDSEGARAKFVDCAIAMGYLHDTARGDIANSFQDDMRKWYKLLGKTEGDRQSALFQIISEASHEWVRLHCAIGLRASRPEISRQVLKEIEGGSTGVAGSLAQGWRMGYFPEQ